MPGQKVAENNVKKPVTAKYAAVMSHTNCFLNSSLLVMNLRVRIVQLFSDILDIRPRLLDTSKPYTLSVLRKRKEASGVRAL